MKPFQKFIEEQRHKLDTTTVQVYGVDLLVKDIPDHSFTVEMYKSTRTNTDGYTMLLPKLDKEAMIHVIEHYMANCSRHDTITYDGALVQLVLPELLKRIKSGEL